MNAVEVSEVSVRYRRGAGADDISFAAAPGAWVALFGRSGCGKTTLLRLLAGRIAPDSGTIRVLERTPRGAARWVGHALEGARFAALSTPHQALGQQLSRHDVPGAQRPARIAEMLELFDLYADRDRPVREFSQGERTALVLAVALVHHPAVLILDNLTAALPAPLHERLRAHLDTLRTHDGLTVVQATTISAEAEQADRVLLMEAGRARAFENPSDLLANFAVDLLTVEAVDPEAVQRTLRGIFDVEIVEMEGGLRFTAADGLAATAHLLRHPTGGVRAVYLRRPTLWEALEKMTG